MTETTDQASPTDSETEPQPKFYVSMSVSIEQPDTATRSTSATVHDVGDLAEEILRAAGGLAQVAQVGDDFRRMTDRCVHVVQVVHKAHPDEVTAAAERTNEVLRALADNGFSTVGPTVDPAATIRLIIKQCNAKQALLVAVQRELAPALRDGDPDEVAAAAGHVAQRLMDYRTNLAEVLDPEVASDFDGEIIKQAVAKLGILGEVNGDQVGPARAAYLGAADSVTHVLAEFDEHSDVILSKHVQPLLDAVKALGVLLDIRVVEPQPDPIPARD